jgi:peptidyl-prolyl cis-trans isomerase D
MFEKLRKTLTPSKSKMGQEKTLKHYVAYVIFGAIIVVFALFGIDNSRMGDETGGVAALVNGVPISVAEYNNRVEAQERNARGRFDQFPEAQRQMLQKEMRKRALEELILTEIVYQAADKRGIIASDAEVRDYILQFPFLNENGKFQRDRYKMFLANQNMTSEDFERQIRKQIVTQKLQELFVGSATPSREELKRNRILANQKVNLRYIEIPKADMGKLISEAEVKDFEAKKKNEIEKYYNANKVEFSKPERVHARHILIAINDKRNADQAFKLATALRKEATPKNFSELAKKNSDDPGSKDSGGALPEFERGHMVPQFEKAAFSAKPGEITPPIKTDYGYHLILVDSKSPAKTETLEEAQDSIARKLLTREKEANLFARLNEAAKSGHKKELESLLSKGGGKWQETGEFDLSTPTIPKIGDNAELMNALLKSGPKGGLVKEVVENHGNILAAEIVSWKETPDKSPDVEGIDRMVAFRKSADLIEGWSKEAEAKANIHRNSQVVR